MKQSVRIGGASGALIDSTTGTPQLIEKGRVDYLVFDYMAELATQMFAKAKEHDASVGYSFEFTDWIWKENVRSIAARGIKVVASAGGLNPQGCRERMERIAREAGVTLKIAVVEGDDLMSRVADLSRRGIHDMFSGEPFPPVEATVSLNAYLGARAVADALAHGADVVITGRVADSALALGPLMFEFGWSDTDYSLLAAGSLAGHILECGPQATGGLFTDWEKVPDWAHIGYPLVECHPDGSFFVTKPPGTGGICSFGTIAEQMLYEIGDPTRYLLPDVVCDFSHVKLRQKSVDSVDVSGAQGFASTSTYKVCGTYTDGYRAVGILPIVGVNAVAKAQRQAAALFERVDEMLERRGMAPLKNKYVEVLGAEASYGARARTRNSREIVSKIVVEHTEIAALQLFNRELRSPIIAMAPGNTGWFPGQPAIAPVVRLFSFLLPKAEVEVFVTLGERRWQVSIAAPLADSAVASTVPQADGFALPPLAEMVEVPLVELAWARSGDKGNNFNIGVIPRNPAYLPYIRLALSEDRLRAYFEHEFSGAANPLVERFDVPGIGALNFVFHEALGGGGMASTRLDAMGKGKAQQLLEIGVPLPVAFAREMNLQH